MRMYRLITFGGLAVQSETGEVKGAATQQRRLALLAVLARAGERGVSRTRLLQLFWPDDEDEERRRKALAQALYALRRDLGHDGVITGTHDIRLDGALLPSDLADFAEQLRAGRYGRAVALYAGPFLDGFQLAGAPAFDRWVDEERRVLERDYVRAVEALATEAEHDGRMADAVQWRYKAAAVDALDSRATLALMRALAAQGEVAAAIRQAGVHEALLRQELDLPPDREVAALAESLRSAPAAPRAVDARPVFDRDQAARSKGTPTGASDRTPVASVAAASDTAPAQPPSLRPGRRVITRVLMAAAAALLLVAGRFAWHEWEHRTRTGDPFYHAPPSIAVGIITDFRDSARGPVRPLAVLLATNLARSEELEVVSAARMSELLRREHAGDSTEAAYMAAARRAGAHELIDGALFDPGDGLLRLDLRRVDLTTGRVLAAITLRGRDYYALADSGTTLLLDAFGLQRLRGRVACGSC